jgi:hypothetical protein
LTDHSAISYHRDLTQRRAPSPGQLNLENIADLALKGVSAPLTFCAAAGVTPDGKAAAQATLSFDRSHWNVLYGSARFS